MPGKPFKICYKAGCHRLTHDTYCDKHLLTGEQLRKHREKFKRMTQPKRATSSQRGYTSVWRKHRKGFLNANPWCVHCLSEFGLNVKADVVDHIKPHKGDDQFFWDQSNWQSLCYKHHNIKTAREDGGFGRKLSKA